MNLELERIALHAERLGLHTLSETVPVIAEDAATKNQSYTEFLERVLRSEAEAANVRATEMIMKTASFPFLRTLEDFDFGFQASVSRKQLRELAGCAFVERRENLIFLGPPGVGKSHLAIALGLEAAKRRLKVKFTTCADLVASLAQGQSHRHLPDTASHLSAPQSPHHRRNRVFALGRRRGQPTLPCHLSPL